MKKYISLAIMISLMDGKIHKAKELAEKYETSQKTVYRSIDLLSYAGMPILITKGRNGGFSLIDASKINTGIFTINELSSFLSFIQTNKDKIKCEFEIALQDRLYTLMGKSGADSILKTSQKIVFDCDIWGCSQNFNEYKSIISRCIESQIVLEIDYNDKDSKTRKIHPYSLVFKAGSWYVYSFCTLKKDFRLFKLSRIKQIRSTNQNFERQNIDCHKKPWNISFEQNHKKIDILLQVQKSLMCDIYDWLGKNLIIVHDNGQEIEIKTTLPHSLGLIHRIMQYGEKITVISPEFLANEIQNECMKIYKNYKDSICF